MPELVAAAWGRQPVRGPSEIVGHIQGSASPLGLQLCGKGRASCDLSQAWRPAFYSHVSLIAFEPEVSESTWAISVLPQTLSTGLPSPASRPGQLGVAPLCLLIRLMSSIMGSYF